MKQKITKMVVDRAVPGEKDTIIRDTEIPGFFLKVTPKGRRCYGLYYRNRDGRERRPMIGVHSEGFTADKARRLAAEWHARVKLGEDPGAERTHDRRAEIFSELAEQYLTEHARQHKKPSSAAADERNLRNHLVPLLGGLKVHAIQPADIDRALRAIANGKTAFEERLGPRAVRKVVGGKGAANRCRSLLSKMLGEFAERKGLRPPSANPCVRIKPYRTEFSDKGRFRHLSPQEFLRLGLVLDEVEQKGSEHPSVVNFVRLALYTGCRRDEILKLRWDHVDFEARCLRLPDTKTGAKELPLGAPALEVIRNIDRQPDNLFVLIGHKPGHHFVGIEKAWHRIRERAGLYDVTIHDLRRSFGSLGARSGMSLIRVGKMLAHKSTKAAEIYARIAEDVTRNDIEATSLEAKTLLSSKPAGQIVVPFRRDE